MKRISCLMVLFSIPSIFSMHSSDRLEIAVSNGESGLIKQYIELGDNPNRQIANPLLFAVSSGDKLLIKLLISHHANPHLKQTNGYSAIELLNSNFCDFKPKTKAKLEKLFFAGKPTQ